MYNIHLLVSEILSSECFTDHIQFVINIFDFRMVIYIAIDIKNCVDCFLFRLAGLAWFRVN